MVKSSNDTWAIPSGGIEEGETIEECCIREVKEETGCEGTVISNLFVKRRDYEGIQANVHYFNVKIIHEKICVNDPDNIIVEASWKSLEEVIHINHAYPEDKEFLIHLLSSNV